MKKKLYSKPVVKEIDLSKISIFCGCGGSSSDDQSCYN